MIDCLSKAIENPQDDLVSKRAYVVQKGLDLFVDIHQGLKNKSPPTSDALQDLGKQKIIHGLLDLISLEGIYPFLSPGVGIPIEKRVQSVFKSGLVTRPSTTVDRENNREISLLSKICLTLSGILEDGNGLHLVLQERTLVDLIAGLGELAYSPSGTKESGHNVHIHRLRLLVDL